MPERIGVRRALSCTAAPTARHRETSPDLSVTEIMQIVARAAG